MDSSSVIKKSRTDLAIELGRTMTELRNQLRQSVQLKIKEHGINITFEMLEVLYCLWQKDGINQQEIADLTLKDKSSMTYMIDNMVKRDMVKRVEDELDRRNKLIFLTEAGTALRTQLYPWIAEVYHQATEDFDKKNLKDSIDMFQQMILSLRKPNSSSD